MVADRSPVAGLPPGDCCSDCGQPVGRRKGRPLVRCGVCSIKSLRARHHAWEQQHREERRASRRRRKDHPLAHRAWRTLPLDDGRVLVVSADGRRTGAVRVTDPARGACACGVAGCVHLVVACLAQQGGGSDV